MSWPGEGARNAISGRAWHVPALAISAVATCAWLLLPALTPNHIEGFSAALAALAIHLARGTLPAFDLLQPLNTQYFGLTKLGAVLAMAPLVGPLHLGSDLALRIMMWAGLAMLLGGSAWLSKRWSGGRWGYALAPLVILPGVIESSFVYNDNVLSAGLAALGLCFLYGRRTAHLACAGILLGLAVITRTDSIFLCLAAPIILLERFGRSKALLTALAVTGTAAAATMFGIFAWFHSSPFESLQIGATAVSIWDRPADGRVIMILLYFLGLPGLLVMAAGAVSLSRQGRDLELARLLVPTLALLAALAGKIWEIRQLLALAPLFCGLAAIGLRAIFEGEETPARRWLRPATVVLVFLSIFGPVQMLQNFDGPRVLAGRAWNVQTWRSWQEGTRRDFAVLDRVVGQAASERLVLLPNSWNEDRYLHLILLDHGFDVVPAAPPEPRCGPVLERFKNGAREILVVRNHQTFVPYWRQIAGERFAHLSLPCLAALRGTPVFLASAKHLQLLLPAAAAHPDFKPAPNDPRADPLVGLLAYGPIVGVKMDAARLAGLLAAYRLEALLPPDGGQPVRSFSEAIAATRSRVRFPR